MDDSSSRRVSARLLGATLAGACLAFAGIAAGVDLASLSSTDASAGLKQALHQGIGRAVDRLGVAGGFLDDPKVKIPLPPKLAKAEGVMRMVGMGDQADSLVVAMNRAAEAAVPEGKALLEQALKQMTVEDAKRILTGGDDAATQYFRRATYQPLSAKFAPVVARETRKVHLTETYDAVAAKGVALGVLKPEDSTLESYVTGKTLDGLFYMMAEEERAIRKDPLGQANALLRKVFGAAH